ncbi:MAG: apolipoprotein N-acyltransferase [Elusimicrobiota bacterium]
MIIYFIPIITSVLLFLSFPPFSLGYLAWVGLIPFFYVIDKTEKDTTRIIISLYTAFIFYSISLFWFYKFFSVFGFVFLIILSAYWMIFGYMAKYINKIWWPLLWFAVEFFRSELSPLKTGFAALGYSQVWNTRLIQSASVIGVYGISLAIVYVNIFIYLFLKEKRYKYIFGAALIFVLMLWGGKYRIKNFENTGKQLNVCGIQSEEFKIESMYELSKKAKKESSEHFDFILWPEGQVIILPGKEQGIFNKLKEYAEELDAYLIAGVIKYKGEELEFENYSMVISPERKILGKYYKHHIILPSKMFFEKNKILKVFNTDKANVATPICYDFDFQDVARKMVKKGTQFFLIPSMIPAYVGGWAKKQHMDMALTRAVESGRWFLRASSSGITHIGCPLGENIKALDIYEKGFLVGEVMTRDEMTLFHRWGYLISYVVYISLGIVFLIRYFRIFKK